MANKDAIFPKRVHPVHLLPVVTESGAGKTVQRMDNQAYANSPDDSTPTSNGSVQPAATPTSKVYPAPHTEDTGDENSEERKPLALCRFFVKRHKLAFGLTLGLHVLLLALTAALMAGGVDVIKLNFQGVPLNLLDHDTYLRALAWLYKDEDGSVLGKDTDASVIGERSRTADNLVLYYRASGTVFTTQRLQEIQKVEERLLAVPEYQDYCQLPPGSTGGSASCLKPLSILRFFDGTYGPAFVDTAFTNVSGTLYRASQIPQLNQILQFHLAKDGQVSSAGVRSSATRTLLYLGFPLPGYDLKADNVTQQLDKIEKFEVDHFLGILEDTMESGAGDMEFLFNSRRLLLNFLISQVTRDMMLSVGSLLFIFLFMLFMTRSLFITGFGVFSILSSFFIANLIYRFVFQYKYFGIFHVLSIFIILGIGADNIFVFMDTWRATAHRKYSSLEHRLSACYRRAASATLYTSLTTMAAFFSNALSPLLGIKSFGLFSGILVFVNYLSVIVFFPTVIVVYHRHWEHWPWPCFRCCRRNRSQDTPADAERHHPIVRFFRGPFYSLLTHRIVRFVLLAFCLALIIMFSAFAAKIEPDEKPIQYLKDSHHYSRAQHLQNYGFKASSQDSVIEVYVVWGLRNQDLGGCDKSDTTCKGLTRWDHGFDLNPKRAQSALIDFCSRLRNLPAAEVDKLKIRRNTVTNELEIECFVDRINAYMQVESSKPQYPTGTDLTLPTTEAKVDTLITSNLAIYNVTSVSPLLYRYFETMMGYWLHDGYARVPGYYDYTVYSQLLGEGRDSFDTQPVVSSSDYVWGTRLLYAAVVINTTLKAGTVSYSTGLPIVSHWDDLIAQQSALMPSSLSGMFQCTPNQRNPWHFLHVQKELVGTAIQGIAVGIALAFVVITLATKNIITGLLATLNIGVVTLSVVGLIPMIGWKLGVFECINLSLVVGLAVDYVVHLAEGYHASSAEDRLTRTRDMLEQVGVSILSGALTTLGAAMFMFGAVIVFFVQFGIFMFATIGFSLLYALCGFSVLMGLLGPQGHTGSLVPVYWWVRFRLRGKRSHHVQCLKCRGKGFHPVDSESPGADNA